MKNVIGTTMYVHGDLHTGNIRCNNTSYITMIVSYSTVVRSMGDQSGYLFPGRHLGGAGGND